MTDLLFRHGRTPAARLAKYRKQAEASYYAGDWRKARGARILSRDYSISGWHQCNAPSQRYTHCFEQSADVIGYTSPDMHRYSDSLRSKPDYGYYADEFGTLIAGAVVRLRCSRGTYYVPCTYDADNGEGVLHLEDAELAPKGADNDVHQEAEQAAARRADQLAERQAQADREWRERDRIEQELAEARETIAVTRETIAVTRASLQQLLRQSRPWRRHAGQLALPGMGPDSPSMTECAALWAALRETVRRRLDTIAECRATIARLGASL